VFCYGLVVLEVVWGGTDREGDLTCTVVLGSMWGESASCGDGLWELGLRPVFGVVTWVVVVWVFWVLGFSFGFVR
jgi:hypothetical protein